jgi:hypothetical protein
MLSVTVRVHGEHRSPLRIHGGYAAPTPTGFAEIVSDDFPVQISLAHKQAGEFKEW